MDKRIIATGAVLAALAVAIGAFGAHALKPALIANGRLETFETAVQYHMFHALGILILGMLPIKSKKIASLAFSFGTLFFSGSLYSLSILNVTIFGAVAPIGGTLFIVGWLIMAYQALRS